MGQLQIPPRAGPSVAAKTFVMPRSGYITDVALHLHPGVETEVWFLVGANISSLMPPELDSFIHVAPEWGGDELSAPSESSTDTSPRTALLQGTGYDLAALKAYARA